MLLYIDRDAAVGVKLKYENKKSLKLIKNKHYLALRTFCQLLPASPGSVLVPSNHSVPQHIGSYFGPKTTKLKFLLAITRHVADLATRWHILSIKWAVWVHNVLVYSTGDRGNPPRAPGSA